jgi:hypothetical protein
MNDDIVTRLREMLRGCENPNCEGCEVESEAADQIERLTAKCKHLESEVARLERASNG